MPPSPPRLPSTSIGRCTNAPPRFVCSIRCAAIHSTPRNPVCAQCRFCASRCVGACASSLCCRTCRHAHCCCSGSLLARRGARLLAPQRARRRSRARQRPRTRARRHHAPYEWRVLAEVSSGISGAYCPASLAASFTMLQIGRTGSIGERFWLPIPPHTIIVVLCGHRAWLPLV